MSTLLKVGLMSVGQISVGHLSVAEKSRHPCQVSLFVVCIGHSKTHSIVRYINRVKAALPVQIFPN